MLFRSGLVPLALGTGSGRDIDRSRRIYAHGCTLERTGARALDIAADTESDKATLAPRLVLFVPECGKPTQGIDGLAKRRGIIPAVIDDGNAVAVNEPDLVRHILRRDHVGQAHRHRIEVERLMTKVRNALTDRQWDKVTAASNELADTLFYLEDT